MESGEWSLPVLTFKIERHGGASLRSSGTEFQHWAVEVTVCPSLVMSFDLGLLLGQPGFAWT